MGKQELSTRRQAEMPIKVVPACLEMNGFREMTEIKAIPDMLCLKL